MEESSGSATLMQKLHLARVIPARCIFAFLANIGFAIIYGLKVNISLAIVVMVEVTKSHHKNVTGGDCKPEDKEESKEDTPGAKYDWDSTVQGYILSSYFWGYIISQVPGAWLADAYSTKWVMWIAVAMNVVGCALSPPFAGLHWSMLLMLRIIQGIGAGVTFPAMHIMISNWSPPSSRSVFTGVIYAGTAIGMIGSTLLAGHLSALLSWEAMFYIMAALCVPWMVMWILWVEDSPTSPMYSLTKGYQSGEIVRHSSSGQKFPYKDILKSLPFWAILVAHVGGNCGLYCFITQVPTFMKSALYVDLKQNTNLSTIPYICMWIVSTSAGPLLDHFRKAGKISTATARKIASTICMMIPAMCLVGVSFIGCSVTYGIICLTVAVGAMGCMTVAYLGNHIDISPNYAGMLMGITNTLATIPGMIVGIFFGFLTKDDNSLARWSIGFYIIAGLFTAAWTFFMIFGAGTVQYWDNPDAAAAEDK